MSDDADENLAAIDVLVRSLQSSAAHYRDRQLDWSDVASLRQIREQLSGAATGFHSAEAVADLSRAARRVATEVRQLRAN